MRAKGRASTVRTHSQAGYGGVRALVCNRIPCRDWHEQVSIDSNDRELENTFWIDNSSGDVVQAHQMLAADAFPVDITILKPAKS